MDQQSTELGDLLFEVRNGIGHATFNRPQARNAFTFEMYERLAQICEQADKDRSIKVLVLQGAGDKAFASGTDINQFRAFKTPEHAIEYESRIDRVLTALEQCRVPTIAAIAGACTGGGAGIAACCDLRVGTNTTRFGFPIARTLGNCLSMSNISRLTSLIGPARTKDLIFKARLVEAPEALALGLLNEVVPDVATLQRVIRSEKPGDVVSLRIQSAFCADLSSFLPDGSGELPGDAMLPRGTRRAVLEGLLETPSGALDRTCSRHSS